jgi:hypothetical protein
LIGRGWIERLDLDTTSEIPHYTMSTSSMARADGGDASSTYWCHRTVAISRLVVIWTRMSESPEKELKPSFNTVLDSNSPHLDVILAHSILLVASRELWPGQAKPDC